MLHVDSALLDLTEWLCRRFQVLTGRTNVWLAFQLTNLSIVVFFVWAGMHFRIGGRLFHIVLAAFCGALLYLGLEEVVWRNYIQIHSGVLGVLIVILLLFLPHGLTSLRTSMFWRKAKHV